MSQIILDEDDKPALCVCKGIGVPIGRLTLADRVVERYQCQRCDRLFTRTVIDADDVAEAAKGGCIQLR